MTVRWHSHRLRLSLLYEFYFQFLSIFYLWRLFFWSLLPPTSGHVEIVGIYVAKQFCNITKKPTVYKALFPVRHKYYKGRFIIHRYELLWGLINMDTNNPEDWIFDVHHAHSNFTLFLQHKYLMLSLNVVFSLEIRDHLEVWRHFKIHFTKHLKEDNSSKF